ncbi:MAG: prolyl oligopeptidase family serine peptidase, partial [Solobacterium sp.]|nr:prolyl oligopeptidase family serine peptidase [Solobacterium sp.]
GQPSGGRLLGNRFAGARWMADSSCVYTTWVSRGHKSTSFVIIHTDGHTETVVEEEADTFLNIRSYGVLDGYGSYGASNFLSKDHKKVIWQSEKDGYARLYAFDVKTKKELYPITPSETIVGELLAEDEESVYFYAGNLPGMSDPCFQSVCRVKLDGEGFQVLTPEDAMHACVMVNGLIIDTYSRVDLAPVTVIRKKDGTFLKELAKADITALKAAGYVMPERFTVKAADGVTDLYGILIRPRDFDETKLYPFVEYIYGGMQCYNVPRHFEWISPLQGREMLGGLEAFAQLGMAGIILDGRGTPGRGKAFHEFSWKNIHGCAGLADHVHALKELKEKYPFLDLERAGIWGNSGGGYASTRAMLEYPGVYKAAVASAGNHDQRMYNENWTENYYGPYDRDLYRKGDNTALAGNLEGHLFIVHGMMDDNVAMAQSARLVDALIRADKDFDFLLLPRVNHNVPADPYFIRRKLDYFVRYLLEETPPDYRFHNSR